MAYALVQLSLTDRIDRKELEEASVVAPSVARGDCARLARDLFGVVVQDLPEEEARALHDELFRRGLRTEVVPQHELPLLPEPVRKRGIRYDTSSFTAIDGLGRETTIRREDVRFAAGGFLNVERFRTTRNMQWNYVPGGPYGTRQRVLDMAERDEYYRDAQFRLELFLGAPPYRWQFPVDSDSIFRVNGQVVRLRQRGELARLLGEIGALFAPGAINLGIAAHLQGDAMVYPSIGAFEEELVWHLFQSLRGGEANPA